MSIGKNLLACYEKELAKQKASFVPRLVRDITDRLSRATGDAEYMVRYNYFCPNQDDEVRYLFTDGTEAEQVAFREELQKELLKEDIYMSILVRSFGSSSVLLCSLKPIEGSL